MVRSIPILFIVTLFSCSEEQLPCESFTFNGINSEVLYPYSSFDRVEFLKGKIIDVELKSVHLDESRKITIYEPPNYDSSLSYGVLFLTDGEGAAGIAREFEYLITEKKMEPIIIVGIHNRDMAYENTVFGDYVYDFRNLEFMKDETLDRMTKQQWLDSKNGKSVSYMIKNIEEAEDLTQDTVVLKIISNRYTRLCSFINDEVITYIKDRYSITDDRSKWTLGGFSSGGAFVFSYSCDHNFFENIIVMSPAGPGDTYNFSNSTSNYFVAAGNKEGYFFDQSQQYLPIFDSLQIPYIHQTFDAGHEWDMWLTFYLQSCEKIYCAK